MFEGGFWYTMAGFWTACFLWWYVTRGGPSKWLNALILALLITTTSAIAEPISPMALVVAYGNGTMHNPNVLESSATSPGFRMARGWSGTLPIVNLTVGQNTWMGLTGFGTGADRYMLGRADMEWVTSSYTHTSAGVVYVYCSADGDGNVHIWCAPAGDTWVEMLTFSAGTGAWRGLRNTAGNVPSFLTNDPGSCALGYVEVRPGDFFNSPTGQATTAPTTQATQPSGGESTTQPTAPDEPALFADTKEAMFGEGGWLDQIKNADPTIPNRFNAIKSALQEAGPSDNLATDVAALWNSFRENPVPDIDIGNNDNTLVVTSKNWYHTYVSGGGSNSITVVAADRLAQVQLTYADLLAWIKLIATSLVCYECGINLLEWLLWGLGIDARPILQWITLGIKDTAEDAKDRLAATPDQYFGGKPTATDSDAVYNAIDENEIDLDLGDT